VTPTEVVEICGALDDAVVAKIVDTGASAAQVLEAFTWLNSDDYLGGELERPKEGLVGVIFDILEAEQPEPEER
jgi:hypothetical protein